MSDEGKVVSFGAAVGAPEKTFDGDGNEIWRVRARALPANIVMNRILFTEDQIKNAVEKFQGVPVLNEHPERGIDIDNSDEMRRHYFFAHVDQPTWNESEKVMDFHVKFDPAKARSLPAGKPLVEAIEKGERLDCSVSMAMKKIPAREIIGEEKAAKANFDYIARTGKPNHVSILTKERPAASQDQNTMINFSSDSVDFESEGDIENFSMKGAESPNGAEGLHSSDEESKNAITWLIGQFRKIKQEDADMADQIEEKAVEKDEASASPEILEAIQSFKDEVTASMKEMGEKIETLEKAHQDEVASFQAKETERREKAIEAAVKLGVYKDASEVSDNDSTEVLEKFAAAVTKDEAKDIPADKSDEVEAPDVQNFSAFGGGAKAKEGE